MLQYYWVLVGTVLIKEKFPYFTVPYAYCVVSSPYFHRTFYYPLKIPRKWSSNITIVPLLYFEC